MSEAEALANIALYLQRIHATLTYIELIILLMLLFKNMGGKEK